MEPTEAEQFLNQIKREEFFSSLLNATLSSKGQFRFFDERSVNIPFSESQRGLHRR